MPEKSVSIWTSSGAGGGTFTVPILTWRGDAKVTWVAIMGTLKSKLKTKDPFLNKKARFYRGGCGGFIRGCVYTPAENERVAENDKEVGGCRHSRVKKLREEAKS